MITKNYKAGFNRGYQQLKQGDVREATKKLWAALGINNRVSFHNYRYGVKGIEPSATQLSAVEAVFAEYEITDIWEDIGDGC